MNSDEITSEPTTPTALSASFMSAPVVALVGTPVHLMTSDQRKMFLQKVRAMRNSPQTLAAQLRSEADEISESVEQPKRKRKATTKKAGPDLTSRYGDLI